MAYGFTDKLRCPGSGFNSIAFALKGLVPGGSWPYRLGVCPPAELPGSNIKYPAGPFLGKTLSNSFTYNNNHGSFDLKFKMAG
jgi:hypothetical protein